MKLILIIDKMLPILKRWSHANTVQKILSNFCIRILYALLFPSLEKVLIDFAGDAISYTAIDPKLKLHNVRRSIIDGCCETIDTLLEKDYNQVIIAGHSLGSVVAYDSLSRLSRKGLIGSDEMKEIVKEKLDRLTGLITFGSPLDKIAYFFWPIGDEEADLVDVIGNLIKRAENKSPSYKRKLFDTDDWKLLRINIQRGLLEHFHGIRGLHNMHTSVEQPKEEQPLNNMLWLNFYHPNDLIAGNLRAFVKVKNIMTSSELADNKESKPEIHTPNFPGAHSYYWYDPRMMNAISYVFLEREFVGMYGKSFDDIEKEFNVMEEHI